MRLKVRLGRQLAVGLRVVRPRTTNEPGPKETVTFVSLSLDADRERDNDLNDVGDKLVL